LLLCASVSRLGHWRFGPDPVLRRQQIERLPMPRPLRRRGICQLLKCW
jgi:hypothetical protein